MQPIQIIATIGPSCATPETISAMITAGMNIARLNFSWGTHDEHRALLAAIQTAAQNTGVFVPVIQDISGPRIQHDTAHGFQADGPILTEKDYADVAAFGADPIAYIAQSFVRSADDVLQLRKFLESEGITRKIIAKIERQEAIDALADIIAVADGIMVARGDLGDNIPYYTLPFVKKEILKACQATHKPAIVATEMLTSMIDDTDPSRADISDIAHAVLDGASATMLSEETAIGTNPVEVVAVMRAVVDEANRHTPATNRSSF